MKSAKFFSCIPCDSNDILNFFHDARCTEYKKMNYTNTFFAVSGRLVAEGGGHFRKTGLMFLNKSKNWCRNFFMAIYRVTNENLPKLNCYNFWMNARKIIKNTHKFSKVDTFILHWFRLYKKILIDVNEYF